MTPTIEVQRFDPEHGLEQIYEPIAERTALSAETLMSIVQAAPLIEDTWLNRFPSTVHQPIREAVEQKHLVGLLSELLNESKSSGELAQFMTDDETRKQKVLDRMRKKREQQRK